MSAGASVERRVQPTNAFVEFQKDEVEQSIASRFEKQVAQHPQRLALRASSSELTYEELNKLANRLAWSIRKHSGPEPVAIAILLDHDAAIVAAILAVLKAGRFYVVLDPSHPSERLRNILEDSEADLLITDNGHLSQAQELAVKNCALLNFDALEPDLPNANPGLETSPFALAYLVYTSGSTGIPKAVCQTQRNVLHHTRKYTNACHLCADDRVALLALCSFSASVSNLFGALLNGAALLPFKVKEQGVDRLADWLREEAISIYHSVPLVFRSLAKVVADRADLPKLRMIKLGGEAITRADFELYRDYFSSTALLYIGLGSSEMNCLRHWLLDHEGDFSGSIAPVGFAVDDTEILLLDEQQEEVPEGEVGEIAIRSNYLFPRYWRRPELDASAFCKNGVGRVFRTGDSGRMLPGGLLQHLGRNEHQVKIRGARIQLSEVESALRNLVTIDNCAVMAKEIGEEKQLVAYLTSEAGDKATASDLRTALLGKLPDYMVPSRFVWLDELPLTNGKIDRKALEKLEKPSMPCGSEYAAPRNELEHQLIEIWSEVLGQERVGVRDNFIELGGHSLTAARIAFTIEQKLGFKLPLSALFRTPTIESLALFLKGDSAEPLSSLVPLQPVGTKSPLFIAHGWGGDVYFYHELAKLLPGQPTYGLQAVGLDGRVPRHIRVEEMAAHYITEMRDLQPEGPYHVVGYSLGSLIAFEIARQLYQLGKKVAFLGLLDPPIRPAPWTAYARTVSPLLWRKARFHLQRWLQTFGRESFHLKRRWKRLRRWVERNQSQAPVVVTLPDKSVDSPQVPGFRDYYSAVASAYRLQRYPGSIDLIVSDSHPKMLLPLWKHLAKDGVRFHQFPGTHRQMIEPEYLPTLASTLAAAIDAASRKIESCSERRFSDFWLGGFRLRSKRIGDERSTSLSWNA